jgi:pimeloyl-ACP methyl ester carboxylesterase
MLANSHPKIVVTVHGIRTSGLWQKKITPYLAQHGLIPYHIDYGWFSALKFFFQPFRDRQLQNFREELRDLISRTQVRRVSVIAHSFGTWLVMAALESENGDLRYDRIVLTGSILPRDYDWKMVLDRKWVMAVCNVRARSDWVVGLASFVSRWLHFVSRLRAGDSGRSQFDQIMPSLLDDELIGGHSIAHNVTKFEKWARFIGYPCLPDDLLKKLTTEMQVFRQLAASVLNMSVDLIRMNLFAPIDGALRIVPGASDNMTYAPEFEMQIEPGHGCTGLAFSEGNPCVVVKRGAIWSGRSLPSDELDKVNPSLTWVMSFPVISVSRGIVVGVINIDGLNKVPQVLRNVTSEPSKSAIMAIYLPLLERVQPCLEAAFRGDKLDQVEV